MMSGIQRAQVPASTSAHCAPGTFQALLPRAVNLARARQYESRGQPHWRQGQAFQVRAAAGEGFGTSSVSSSKSAGRRSSGGGGAAAQGHTTLRAAAEASNVEVYDKLIAAFSEWDSGEWRKLIAFSKQWPKLAPGVFDRMEQRVKDEADEQRRVDLRKLSRKLKEVHQETEQYRALVARFLSSPPADWEGVVAVQRAVLTSEFFAFADSMARASADNPSKQEELLALLGRVAALVTAFDQLEDDEDAMKGAAQKFQHLLEVGSLEEMDSKIDSLAATGQLDPALMLMMAKAHQSTKDTDVTREEVRDIMAHLYFKAKESFAAQQPPEIRIMKHLLSLDDPKERAAALGDAFTPGPEMSTGEADYLSTTPERLMTAMGAVLTAYEAQRGKAGSLVGEAAALMNPAVIERMRELQAMVRKGYM